MRQATAANTAITIIDRAKITASIAITTSDVATVVGGAAVPCGAGDEEGSVSVGAALILVVVLVVVVVVMVGEAAISCERFAWLVLGRGGSMHCSLVAASRHFHKALGCWPVNSPI